MCGGKNMFCGIVHCDGQALPIWKKEKQRVFECSGLYFKGTFLPADRAGLAGSIS